MALLLLPACGPKTELGGTCKRDKDCTTGTCLAIVDSPVCTKDCLSDADCGSGLSCYESSATGYCAPSDTKAKPVGAVCTQAAECDHRICVKSVMNVNSGYCSKLCKDGSECAAGGKCAKGIGGSANFCQK